MSKPIVWSNGLGVQSTAIAVLVRQGRLPKPDRIVTADTGWEFKRTWEYTEQYVSPMLAEIGLEIEVAPHSLSKVDLYSHKGEVLIPAFTQNAKLPTFCSSEWKMLVVRRYLRSVGVRECVMWMGMSIDEIQRLKHSSVQWIENYWPLCFDVKMTRGECAQLVKDYGLPEPIKSRCKMCPHQSDNEWIEVQNEPDEWKEAIKIDEQIYASHQVRLHKSGKPLPEVQFTAKSTEGGGLVRCV
ncbi:MAG TPA: hypothetical protein VF974_00775 [Patescibacteria group bacterium]